MKIDLRYFNRYYWGKNDIALCSSGMRKVLDYSQEFEAPSIFGESNLVLSIRFKNPKKKRWKSIFIKENYENNERFIEIRDPSKHSYINCLSFSTSENIYKMFPNIDFKEGKQVWLKLEKK